MDLPTFSFDVHVEQNIFNAASNMSSQLQSVFCKNLSALWRNCVEQSRREEDLSWSLRAFSKDSTGLISTGSMPGDRK